MSEIYDKFSLAGRVAIVTGGPGLLGKEFCKTLAEAGAAVVVADINGEGAEATADTLTKAGWGALGVQVDVTNPESVQAMVDKALKVYGRLDILVNSAALDPKFDPQALAALVLVLPGSRTPDVGTGEGCADQYLLDVWAGGA
jgi:NAD(P)-dependent dehydrogenase (short-subunit alcohol dehydrogenase family)